LVGEADAIDVADFVALADFVGIAFSFDSLSGQRSRTEKVGIATQSPLFRFPPRGSPSIPLLVDWMQPGRRGASGLVMKWNRG
jgi:hypothetical protein